MATKCIALMFTQCTIHTLSIGPNRSVANSIYPEQMPKNDQGLHYFVTHQAILTLVLLNPDILCFANSVDPDQLASEEAN